MAGPYPLNDGVGSDGPHTPGPDGPYGQPPAVPFPRTRSRRRLVVGIALAAAAAAVLTLAVLYGVRTNGANSGGAVSEKAAHAAIQGYLDALEKGDVEGITRNTLCGLYDGVRDKRSDEALARLSSEAFRKQFSGATVTSIDKLVYLSQYQTQTLFTVKLTPANGGTAHDHVQGIAQLLFQRGQVNVCSYVLRAGGSF